MIEPHRSLAPRGLRRVLIVLAVCCGLTGAMAVRLGAWPVAGFVVPELLLAAFLLRLNAREGLASERLLLSQRALKVIRTDRRGVRHERVMSPGWLQVELRRRHGRAPALLVRAHGAEEEIGSFLGEREKRDLAAALREALHRQRAPLAD